MPAATGGCTVASMPAAGPKGVARRIAAAVSLVVATGLLAAAPAGAASTIGVLDKADVVALQADNKIVVGSEAFLGPRNDLELHPAVARVNTDGSLDTGFGNGGFTILPPVEVVPFDLLVQPDGKILLLGSRPGGSDF